MKNPASAYNKSGLAAKVMGSTPHELHQMLLDKLCERLNFAQSLLSKLVDGSGNNTATMSAFAEAIDHAYRIVQSFKDALIVDNDEILGKQLSDLYDFMMFHLAEVIQKQDEQSMQHVLKTANELSAMWQTIPEAHRMKTGRV